MKSIFQAAVLGIVISILQACANSSPSVPVSTPSSMSGTPSTDYIYRSPSYQISHGRM